MDRFRICFVEGADGGKYYKHSSLKSAQIEAERLARLPENQGRYVYILEDKGRCYVTPSPLTWDIPRGEG